MKLQAVIAGSLDYSVDAMTFEVPEHFTQKDLDDLIEFELRVVTGEYLDSTPVLVRPYVRDYVTPAYKFEKDEEDWGLINVVPNVTRSPVPTMHTWTTGSGVMVMHLLAVASSILKMKEILHTVQPDEHYLGKVAYAVNKEFGRFNKLLGDDAFTGKAGAVIVLEGNEDIRICFSQHLLRKVRKYPYGKRVWVSMNMKEDEDGTKHVTLDIQPFILEHLRLALHLEELDNTSHTQSWKPSRFNRKKYNPIKSDDTNTVKSK